MSSGSLARTMMPATSAACARRVSGLVSGATSNCACGDRIASPSGWMALVSNMVGLEDIYDWPFNDGIGQVPQTFHGNADGCARLEPRRRLMHRTSVRVSVESL